MVVLLLIVAFHFRVVDTLMRHLKTPVVHSYHPGTAHLTTVVLWTLCILIDVWTILIKYHPVE